MSSIPSYARFIIGMFVAIAASASVPAAAQCGFCGITPGDPAAAGEEAPLEIALETTLDFDRIIVDGNGSGSVRLLPDGTSGFSGSVESIGGRAQIGRVVIRGAPNRAIHVAFPDQIELVGMKGSILTVRQLVTNLPSSPALDSSGQLVVDFGGELDVQGDADGNFRGNLIVRADYL